MFKELKNIIEKTKAKQVLEIGIEKENIIRWLSNIFKDSFFVGLDINTKELNNKNLKIIKGDIINFNPLMFSPE